MIFVFSVFVMSVYVVLDLCVNEQLLLVICDLQVIVKILLGYCFVELGMLMVVILVFNLLLLVLLVSDNCMWIGSDLDIVCLLVGSFGLKFRLVFIVWEDWLLGIVFGCYDVVLINIVVIEKCKEKFDFVIYWVDFLVFLVKFISDIVVVNGFVDFVGCKVIVGFGINQEWILLGWNEDNCVVGWLQVQLVYLIDDVFGNFYIQFGWVDIFFGLQLVVVYKVVFNGQIWVVGLGLKKVWVVIIIKKGNGLVYVLQVVFDGVIVCGEYQQVLVCWGEQGEVVVQLVVNLLGIIY